MNPTDSSLETLPTLNETKETSDLLLLPLDKSFPSPSHSHSQSHPLQIVPEPRTRTGSEEEDTAVLVVVCLVDGTVSTFDAWTGQFKGMFSGGGPLIQGSDVIQTHQRTIPTTMNHPRENPRATILVPNHPQRDDPSQQQQEEEQEQEGDDGMDENLNHEPASWNDPTIATSSQTYMLQEVTQRIVPSLDGTLYSLFNSYQYPSSFLYDSFTTHSHHQFHLEELPIHMQDIMDNPISLCLPLITMTTTIHSDLYPSFPFLSSHSSFSTKYKEGAKEDVEEENEEDEDHDKIMEQCGVVMGQRSTQLYALDPTTGLLHWIPENKNSSHSKNNNKKKKKKTRKQNIHHHHNQHLQKQQQQARLQQQPPTQNQREKEMTPTSLSYDRLQQQQQQQVVEEEDGENRKDQDSNHSHEKDPPSNPSKKYTILLQRNNYFIQHFNIETGQEIWNVTFGQFLALDFDTPTTKRKNHNHRYGIDSSLITARDEWTANQHPEEGNEEEDMENPFHTTSSSSSNNNNNNIKKAKRIQSKGPTIYFGPGGTSILAMDSETNTILWEQNMKSMVASVYGVHRSLGQQQPKSHPKDMKYLWVPLQVTELHSFPPKNEEPEDEQDHSNTGGSHEEEEILHYNTNLRFQDDRSQQHQLVVYHNRNIGIDNTSSSTVRTHAPNLENHQKDIAVLSQGMQIHPNNRKDCPLFPFIIRKKQCYQTTGSSTSASTAISSTQPATQRNYKDDTSVSLYVNFDWESDFDPRLSVMHSPLQSDYDSREHNDDDHRIELAEPWSDEHEYLQTDDEDSREYYGYSNNWDLYNARLHLLKTSHKTEHGLFLSWRVVAMLCSCMIIGLIVGRLLFLKKKRQWIVESSTPHLLSMYPNSDSEDGKGSNHPPSLSLNDKASYDDTSLKIQSNQTPLLLSSPSPVVRSLSFPQVKSIVPLLDLQTSDMRSKPTISTAAPTRTQLSMAPMEKSKDLKNSSTSIATGGVTSIDGIPFVRYSRYKSEFNEICPLGEGGFGTVFKCSNALDGREYAIKKVLIKTELDANGQMTKPFSKKFHRVLREVKILALLDHPNIVRYYTAWLEVESEDNAVDDITTDSMESMSQRQIDVKLNRGFSSDLLAGHTSSNITCQDQPADRITSATDKRFYVSRRDIVPLGLKRVHSSDEDLGFVWEQSQSITTFTSTSPRHAVNKALIPMQGDNSLANAFDSFDVSSNSSEDGRKRVDNLYSVDPLDRESKYNQKTYRIEAVSSQCSKDEYNSRSTINVNIPKFREEHIKIQRHILYIQMQLSKKTLLDYFQSRHEQGTQAIDIIVVLRMFAHIVRGVKHVHRQGLIHRDLKPSNCFLDDSEVVKIGDFGLSRESSSHQGNHAEYEDTTAKSIKRIFCQGTDNTAGVGTSSYASPEQINGSDYDSSTDVYSLGIILFELCYPMRTAMERFKAFDGIRRHLFPEPWDTVAKQFPLIHTLIKKMLSQNPKERPTSLEVSNQVESLLSEYTVLFLDRSETRQDGCIFLRVEAIDSDGVLARMIQLIKSVSADITIVQYSLRGQDSKAIMEFALIMNVAALKSSVEIERLNEKEEVRNDHSIIVASLQQVVNVLEKCDEVKLVRRISNEKYTQSELRLRH